MMPDAVSTIDPVILDAALDWHVRQETLDEAGWLAFVDWLEAAPAHAAAFDRVATADHALAATRPAFADPVIAPVAIVPPRRRGWALGGTAIAAGLAALVIGTVWPRADTGYVVTTRPGERRTIELADATRIDLNGGTSLRLDSANLRVATLERGEATFHVHHDAGAPFTLASGAREVRDVGTVFNAARDGTRFEVGVAEGSVMVDPATSAVALSPGQALVIHDDTQQATRMGVDPRTVGGWRGDRLAFTGTPMSSVAAALERRYAVKIRLVGGLSARPFTGMVALSGTAARDVPHIAALIGATWQRDGLLWTLAPETPAR